MGVVESLVSLPPKESAQAKMFGGEHFYQDSNILLKQVGSLRMKIKRTPKSVKVQKLWKTTTKTQLVLQLWAPFAYRFYYGT